VTVLILGMVLSAATAAFISSSRTSSIVDNRVENLGQAQLLIRNATKDVRTATPINDGAVPAFISAAPWEVVFYAYLNTTSASVTTSAIPNKVRLYVNATTDPKNPTLVEEVSTPTAGWTPTSPTYVTPAKLRFVGQYLTNTVASGTQIFKFYDNSSPPAEIVPAGAAGSFGPTLTAAQLSQVFAVKISLRVRKANIPGVRGTTLETRVRLPNVIYTPVPGTG
jgi:type II secretory pathway pseudopilin PulG